MTDEVDSHRAPSIFFLHLPKTGGVSLQTALSVGLAPDRALVNIENCSKLLPSWQRLRDLDLLAGHVHWPTRHLLRRPLQTVTLFRNPLVRAVSAFRHIERDRGHGSNALLRDEAPTLDAALRHPKLRYHFLAPYTQLLGVEGTPLAQARHPAEVVQALRSLSRPKPPDEPMFQRALAALKAFDFVGLTEELDRDGPRLLAGLRDRPLASLEHLNAAPSPSIVSDLPAGLRADLEAALRLDMLLWEAARERVDRDRRAAS